MGCFLRHDFEEELKSSSQQHESQCKTCSQGWAVADRQRCGKLQGALIICRARRIRDAS
jgi:hypothetical protein